MSWRYTLVPIDYFCTRGHSPRTRRGEREYEIVPGQDFRKTFFFFGHYCFNVFCDSDMSRSPSSSHSFGVMRCILRGRNKQLFAFGRVNKYFGGQGCSTRLLQRHAQGISYGSPSGSSPRISATRATVVPK